MLKALSRITETAAEGQAKIKVRLMTKKERKATAEYLNETIIAEVDRSKQGISGADYECIRVTTEEALLIGKQLITLAKS